MKFSAEVNSPISQSFRITYLARGGRGGGGGGILTIACLTFYLLLSYKPILGLREYKIKVINICEMQGARGREVVVFD